MLFARAIFLALSTLDVYIFHTLLGSCGMCQGFDFAWIHLIESIFLFHSKSWIWCMSAKMFALLSRQSSVRATFATLTDTMQDWFSILYMDVVCLFPFIAIFFSLLFFVVALYFFFARPLFLLRIIYYIRLGLNSIKLSRWHQSSVLNNSPYKKGSAYKWFLRL